MIMIFMVVLFLLLQQVANNKIEAVPRIGNCDIFPENNHWNTPIEHLPVHSKSQTWLDKLGVGKCTENQVQVYCRLHADFGSGLYDGAPIGIPINVIKASDNVPFKPVDVFEYPEDSDFPSGGMPIPFTAKIEGGFSTGNPADGDRHVICLYEPTCQLYELHVGIRPETASGTWQASSTALFNLTSNNFRPLGWTSADAAGLPILPGLVRYDEVLAGEINHALRFTVQKTTKFEYTWPATHKASYQTDPDLPRMGDRFRLKASFDIDDPTKAFSEESKVIFRAMKKYGLIIADNGSPFYIQGEPDERWDNSALNKDFKGGKIRASDFELVDQTSMMVSEDSGEAKTPTPTTRAPTKSPTTRNPTRSPSTKSPTTRNPTKSPTTKAPTTVAPTKSPFIDCPRLCLSATSRSACLSVPDCTCRFKKRKCRVVVVV